MMSDAKYEIHQTEQDAPVRRSKNAALRRHCKRFWWLHLIILICGIVLVVCLMLRTAKDNLLIEPFVQHLRRSPRHRPKQGQRCRPRHPGHRRPRIRARLSFLMRINSTITTDGSVKADIDPFSGNMYLGDSDDATSFATLHFPATNADAHQVVNITQRVAIADMKAFNQFNTDFFKNESTVRVQGNTQIKPAGIVRKYDVVFRKIVTLKALNLLRGTKVVDGNINLMTSPGQPNFVGVAEIPNPSIFTLDIGNATFNTYADGAQLGNLTIDNLILFPGTNKLNVASQLDQAKVLTIMAKRPYCETGILPFQLLGTDVTNNGKKLDYFISALGSANQTVDINIASIIGNVIPNYKPKCSN